MSIAHNMQRGIFRRVYASGLQFGKRINAVSLGAEFWFFRLNAVADDYGNFRAEAELLKSTAAPCRKISTKQIDGWMAELTDKDHPLIAVYEVDGERLGHILDFQEMQPAGKNGKRVMKHARWPHERELGESKFFQGNPVLTPQYQSGPAAVARAAAEPDADPVAAAGPDDPSGEAAAEAAGPEVFALRSAAALLAAAKPAPVGSTATPALHPQLRHGPTARGLSPNPQRFLRQFMLLGIGEPRRSEFAAIPELTEEWLNDLVRRKETGKHKPGWAIRAIEDEFNLTESAQ